MYKLGTKAELEGVKSEIESAVQRMTDTNKDASIIMQAIDVALYLLDNNYGENRNWQEEGGYVAVFTEVTQDDNAELLELLAQYNQDLSCIELDRTLKTIEIEQGFVDWLSEIYLIGTEFGIAVIRPRLRQAFDGRTPRYLSRDVANYVPVAFHEFLYRSIEKMREKVALDYLQIVKLSLKNKKNGLQLELEHWQEQPPCKQTTYWEIPPMEGIFDFVEKWNGKKLYIIDDGIAITTVFPYER